MGKTSLKALVNKPALMTHKEDSFWPIPDQFMGVEIEIEGYDADDLTRHIVNGEPYWAQHRDGSLRGRNAVELVLNQPMMGNNLKEAIHYYFRTFKTVTPSPRTSIHIHVNMLQDEESLEGLKNMVILYYMYEDAFFAIADENRKWNGYCNPFSDQPPDILKALMQHEDINTVARVLRNSAEVNQNRYYGLNINALQRYGTLEFRHLPLITDESKLLDWMKMIMELKLAGSRMADEGVTPGQVFLCPDDLIKLQSYMPTYGKTLLQYVDQGTAFARMGNVTALRIRQHRRNKSVEGNGAWGRFLKAQEEAGRKIQEAPPRNPLDVWDEMQRRVANGEPVDAIERAEALAAAQREERRQRDERARAARRGDAEP
jgi:hypothetical protein